MPARTILTAAERVRRENRRDMPFGLSTSVLLHALFIPLFVAAAVIFVVPDLKLPPQEQEQKSQIITIETLVRTPQQVQRQQVVQQPQTRAVISQMDNGARSGSAGAGPTAHSASSAPQSTAIDFYPAAKAGGSHGIQVPVARQQSGLVSVSSVRSAISAQSGDPIGGAAYGSGAGTLQDDGQAVKPGGGGRGGWSDGILIPGGDDGCAPHKFDLLSGRR